MTEEELAKIQDGTTVIVRREGHAVAADGRRPRPGESGHLSGPSADDGECICRVEDVAKVG